MRTTSSIVAAWLCLTGLAGCRSLGTAQFACSDDGDCDQTHYCSVQNFCVSPCNGPSQCEPGEQCVAQRCTPVSDAASSTASSSSAGAASAQAAISNAASSAASTASASSSTAISSSSSGGAASSAAASSASASTGTFSSSEERCVQGTSCSTGNPCLTGGTCQNDGSCGGEVMIACPQSHLPECTPAAGRCVCPPGHPCGENGACSQDGRCEVILHRDVVTGDDDAYEDTGGNVDLNDNMETLTVNNQWLGLRFRNIPMPLGSTVVSAQISVKVGSQRKPGSSILEQVKSMVPVFDDNNDNDISSRADVMYGSVPWSLPTDQGQQDAYLPTPELNTLLAAHLQSGEWMEGQDVAFLFHRDVINHDMDFHMFEDQEGPASLMVHFLAPAQ